MMICPINFASRSATDAAAQFMREVPITARCTACKHALSKNACKENQQDSGVSGKPS